jgi:hypothetical protein
LQEHIESAKKLYFYEGSLKSRILSTSGTYLNQSEYKLIHIKEEEDDDDVGEH